MAKKMLIDATHPEETRVVVVDGQKVDDFDFESITKRQLAGNIYLAKVTRVEPSLQAAFVEYGGNRHGFLAFAEIHPDYYQIPVADREALLAEEEREEEARRAREEEDEGKPKRSRERKPRKERTRGRKKKDDASDETGTAVAGLEVIDVVSGDADGDSPAGLEVADVVDNAPGGMEVTDLAAEASDDAGEVVDAVPAADSAETVEIAEAPEEAAPEEVADAAPEPVEQTETEVVAEDVAEAPAEDAPQETVEMAEAAAPDATPDDTVAAEVPEEAAPSEDVPTEASTAEDMSAEEASEETSTDSDEVAPRTIAESAGLEDEEAVTELVGDPGSAQTLTGDAAAEAVAEAATPEQAVDVPAEASSTEAQAEEAVAAESAPSDAASEEAPQETAAEAAETEAEAETAPQAETAPEQAEVGIVEPEAEPEAEVEAPKPKRRRSRKSKKDEAKAEDTKAADAEASEPAQEAAADESRKDDTDDSSDLDGDDDDSAPEEVDEVGAEDTLEEVAKARTRLRRKYKIQDVIKVRQIMLVQVVKEERGNKGAALTTYLSLAGRYCVLMPNTARGGGISRKITNASDRKRLREVTSAMDVPKGMGLIVRTAGAERTKAEIKRDYEFLIRQWEQIRDLTLQSVAPTLIYEEGSLIKRSIRDVYNKDIDQILVEGETGYREAKEYMKMLMPSHAKNVQPYTDQIPLFSRYQVESYLNGMFNPTVQLKSGGYIVIGITEALVAIDVNSGRATKQGSIEETALQTNLEAAEEVARQARLRDLAGLIVIDFIDMDENRNNRAVEKRMKDRLKNDRARIQVGRISAFGLMEMSRQRLRPGMLEATTQPCPHCHATGLIRSDENLSLSILREVEEEALRGRADEIIVRAPIDVANYLINNKRQHVAQLEQRHGITVAVMAVTTLMSPKYEIERSKTSSRQAPRVQDVVSATSVAEDVVVEDAEVLDEDRDGDESRSRRRRGKRGGRRKRGENAEAQGAEQAQTETGSAEARSSEARSSEDGEEDGEGRRGRRRRRRGGRGRRNSEEQAQTAEVSGDEVAAEDQVAADAPVEEVSDTVSENAAMPAEDTVTEAVAEDTTEAEAEGVIEAAELSVEETTEATLEDGAETEPTEEPAAEPEQTRELEVATAEAEPAEPAPEEPAKPKRRGWWSFGRG